MFFSGKMYAHKKMLESMRDLMKSQLTTVNEEYEAVTNKKRNGYSMHRETKKARISSNTSKLILNDFESIS